MHMKCAALGYENGRFDLSSISATGESPPASAEHELGTLLASAGIPR